MASLRPPVALLAAALTAAALAACEPASRCDRVTCSGGRVCNPASGACEGGSGGGDGGTPDGGAACAPACDAGTVCDPAAGACVQCLTDADCLCPSPTCSTAQVCVANGTPTVTPSESCAGAPTLRACAGTLHFTVDLSGAADDLVGSCGAAGAGGRDRVVNLVTDALADVLLVAQPATGSQAQPVVSVRQTCAASGDLACADGLGGAATVRLRSLPAGTYSVVFDSYDAASAGVLDVVVTLSAPTPPANDTCGRAQDLLADGSTLSVDLAPAEDDLLLSCNPTADSPEAFYRFTLASASDLTLTAEGKAGTGQPVVALLQGCAAGAELACTTGPPGGTAQLRRHALAAGTYQVAVETRGRTDAGLVSLTATASAPQPPPFNDTCSAPRAITFPAGASTTTFPVDTWAASDDEQGSCNSEPGSPEVVWELTLGAARTVTVSSVGAAGSATDAVVYLRGDACTDAGVTEYACADFIPPAPDTFTVPLAAGTYWLFVEGYGPDGAGPTQVTVTLAP